MLTTDASTPYTVPAGGGEITQWQTNTSGDTGGVPITFVALRPVGNFAYLVVGDDTEALPAQLPADNIVTFTLNTPIVVSGGDTLDLYARAGGYAPTCLWKSDRHPSMTA